MASVTPTGDGAANREGGDVDHHFAAGSSPQAQISGTAFPWQSHCHGRIAITARPWDLPDDNSRQISLDWKFLQHLIQLR